MEDNLKDKVLCVVDNGLFVNFARSLSSSFKEVLYFTEWRSAFPTKKSVMVGEGFSELTRINSVFDAVGMGYTWFFPDVYDGDFQTYLVEQGENVFGCRQGEEMELERDWMKKHMKKLDLPVGEYKVIEGLDALRKYLKENDKQYIKCNCYRADFETAYAENYKLIEPFLDELEQKLGAMKFHYEFVVEKAIDGKDVVEVGSDMYTVDGKYPSTIMFGYEIKDIAYCGVIKPYKNISNLVTDFNTSISGTLEQYQYRGMFSTEIRVGKDKVPYQIDFCARLGSPPNELYQEMISNWADIIYYGAQGVMVEPKFNAKYGIEFLIHSDWADLHWQAIYFPEEISRWVKLRNSCKINDIHYVVPQSTGLPEIGAVVAIGDSLEECIEKAMGYAEKVEGYRLDIKTDAVDKIMEAIKKGESLGIKFGE